MLPAALVDTIAIEAPAGEEPVSHVAAESCNLALGDARCHMSGALEPHRGWYVRIVWLDEQRLRARLDVHRNGPDSAVLTVRKVEFSAQDPLEQRYRALGLLVASHVIGTRREPPRATVPAVLPQPPAQRTESEPPRWGFDLAALGGPGLNGGPARFGGLGRLWIRPLSWPVLGFIGMRWARAGADPQLDWTTASFGIAVQVTTPNSPLGLQVRNEAAAQWVDVVAGAPNATDERDSVRRYGAILGLDAMWAVGSALTLFAGVDGTVLRPEYTLDIRGVREGEEPATRWSAALGMRFSP